MKLMQRPSPGEYHEDYQEYFDLVANGDYLDLLSQNANEVATFFEEIPAEKHDYRYAEGKWSIKEVLMHVIDTERVFAYRALAGARGDVTPHFRMDEELYAKNVEVSHRTVQNLMSEFKAVRGSTQELFGNLTDAQSRRSCNIVTHPMTARAIGYFIIGHVQHHLNVIEERYL